MPSRLWPGRSPTPVTMGDTRSIKPVRWSAHRSVTRVPPPSAANSYVHLATGNGPAFTSKANDRPGSASTTVQVVDHRRHPLRLLPLNLAPTAGPVTPPSQRQEVVSGLHSPIRVTSLTSSYNFSGGASMCSSTLISRTGQHYGGADR